MLYTDVPPAYQLTPSVRALVVMAAEAEYGENLKRLGIKPLFIGVGPIQAAMSLQKALSRLTWTGLRQLPDVIINLGSAGSGELEQTQVYRVGSTSYRDMDASAFGFDKGSTPFSNYPGVIALPEILRDFPTASCSTGANVVNDHTATGAQMAEMEHYALSVVALENGVPLIAFKGVSDGKKPLTGELLNWTEALPIIDKNLATAMTTLQKALEAGTLTKAELCQMPPCWIPEQAAYNRAGAGARAGLA